MADLPERRIALLTPAATAKALQRFKEEGSDWARERPNMAWESRLTPEIQFLFMRAVQEVVVPKVELLVKDDLLEKRRLTTNGVPQDAWTIDLSVLELATALEVEERKARLLLQLIRATGLMTMPLAQRPDGRWQEARLRKGLGNRSTAWVPTEGKLFVWKAGRPAPPQQLSPPFSAGGPRRRP